MKHERGCECPLCGNALRQDRQNLVAAYLVAFIALLSLAGCATSSGVSEERSLYTGSSVRITADEGHTIRGTRSLTRDLENAIRPEPNTTVFGSVRPGLLVYSLTGARQPPGLRARFFDRYGEYPVYFDRISPEAGERTIRAMLTNRGYFDAEVSHEITEHRGGTGVRFHVILREPYTLRTIRLPTEESLLASAVREAALTAPLESGTQYDLATLVAARQHIDRVLKDEGFYAFNPGYLRFDAARDHELRRVDLHLTIIRETPEAARVPYHIRSVTVYADSDPPALPDERVGAGEEVAPGFYYVAESRRLRSSLVKEVVLLNPGSLYRRSDHLATIERLSSLGLFRFVTVRYVYHGDEDLLDALIFLSPLVEQAVEGEIQIATRPDNLAGPSLRLGYRDRNVFEGAEQFSLDVRAGADTKLGSGEISVDQWELGAAASLSVPGIIAPLIPRFPERSPALPRTTLTASASSLTRLDAYRLDEVSTSLGYSRRPSPTIRHEIRPISLSLVRPAGFSPDFENLLEENPALRLSFTEQLIVGPQYSVTYDNSALADNPFSTNVHISVEAAGITLSAVDRGGSGEILGTQYSQFVRFDTDTRNTFPVSERSRFATRLLAGSGYAFGNVSALPLTRQFSVGGPNSIRAVPARSIGPGALAPTWDQGPAFDRSAGVRVEANAEYRFPLLRVLNGAVFADAGNIWTAVNDKTFEDTGASTGISPASVLSQSALGSGIGLRADFNVFVVRLDVATLLRKPWLDEDARWVVSEIAPGDTAWRRDNLVYNLAIGYPF